MGNDTNTTFSVRQVKGGYILSLGVNTYGRNDSIHPSVDDLILAIRHELDNPTNTLQQNGYIGGIGMNTQTAATNPLN